MNSRTDSGYGLPLWLLVTVSLVCGVALVTLMIRHTADVRTDVLLGSARSTSQAVTAFRDYYAREVVGRLRTVPNLAVTDKFRDFEHSVPLPFTLTIELSKELQKSGGDWRFSLVSQHPFPQRQSRALSAFENEALSRLGAGDLAELTRTVETGDKQSVLLATPVVMGAACVSCHNNHPESPKKDWNEGDVRGVQVVTVSSPVPASLSSSGLLNMTLVMVVGFAAAMSLVMLLVRRNRRALGSVEEMANTAALSEARTRAIVESSVDGIITIDAKGKIESCNAAAVKMLGYDTGALIGKNVSVLFPDGGDDAFTAHDIEASWGDRASNFISEVECRRQDGSLVPVDLSVSAYHVGSTRYFTGILRDISERKLAQAKTQEAETRLIDAIEALPDGFVLYDKNDRLVVCNERYRQIYATSAPSIKPGTTFEEIIRYGAEHGQYDLEGLRLDDWVKQRLEAHQSPRGVIEQQLDDGTWLRIIETVTEDGRRVGFRVDITELKEREQALTFSQSRFRTTIEAALDGIIVIDKQGTVVEFNPAAESIFGYERHEIVGRKMGDLIVPHRYREAHDKGIKTFLETGEGPILGKRFEIEALHADGREFIIEVAIQEAQGPEGPIFVGYTRDVTDKKAAESQLIEAKERAEVANRAKASFLAMMSHEIRTPLNGVLGILNLLGDTPGKSEQERLIRTAQTSGKALMTIINDILDFSKLEAGKLDLDEVVFLIDQMVNGVQSLVAPRAKEKGIGLTVDFADDLPDAVYGDPGRIRQILLNLAWNAIKFTEQGDVRIAVRKMARDDDKATLRFSVTDTGIGIPDEKHSELFAEFATLDAGYSRKFGGTGLGLAICKTLVDAMGGEIDFESEVGKGSTFWFDLALKIGDGAQVISAEAEEQADLPEIGPDLRILVAEDNPTNQLVISNMLERLGCRVDVVGNGIEAVEAVRNRPYSAVLMDVSMPEMDGITATRAIRDLDTEVADIPIIALTAYALDEDRQRAFAAGMSDFLSKPVARIELARALSKVAGDLVTAGDSVPDASTAMGNIFDMTVFDTLIAGMDPAVQEKALKQFQSDLEDHCERLAGGCADADIDRIERSSHTLKGIAGTFGASALQALAERVNTAARHKGDAVPANAADLIDLCTTTIEALKEYRQSNLQSDQTEQQANG